MAAQSKIVGKKKTYTRSKIIKKSTDIQSKFDKKKKDYIFNKHLVLGFGHFLIWFQIRPLYGFVIQFYYFCIVYYRIHR